MGPAQAGSSSTSTPMSTPAAGSTPSTTVETLPANIPCLEPNGSNWAIFSMRFCEAMTISRRWGHFDGTDFPPAPKDPANILDTEKAETEKWEYDNKVASYLLSPRL